MMRVKDFYSKNSIDSDRVKIAEYLHLKYEDVIPLDIPTTYMVNLDNNLEAQKAYKKRNPFGNGYKPGIWDFKKDILVRWQENKLQAM